MNIFESVELLKGLGYMTAYVTAALPCHAAASDPSPMEFFPYNLFRPNIIVKIRTGKVNEMEILKIISFF